MSSDLRPALLLLGTLEIGGSETKFVALANRLHQAGLPLHVAYLRNPDDLLPRLEGIPHVHLGQTGKWSRRAYRALHDYVGDHGVGSIVTVNPYPLTYAAVGRFESDREVRVIASINTSEFLSRKEKLFMLLYSRLLRRCDHVVFGSSQQRSLWLSTYSIPASNSSVIYNGVDSSYFSPQSVDKSRADIRESLKIPVAATVIVCVSQFRPEKGHGRLLEAVHEINSQPGPGVHLILVGDGAERDSIIRKINELGLSERVHLSGSTDDVRPFLKAADLFALTSVAVETFSNAALEAASMGLPVVMSDVGGAREMFPDSEECLIYPKHDQRALVRGLRKIADRATERAGEFGPLRNEVLSRYSVDAMDSAWRQTLWSTG